MTTPGKNQPLRLGYLALTDAAPIAVASELGLFGQFGLEVELSREVGWATIREKIIYGELEAAHAPAPMLWSTRMGIDSAACKVLTALVFNLHGSALTLSSRLWKSGVRTDLEIRDEARRRSGERKLTFGVVFGHSSHSVLLRAWLTRIGLNPDRDVRIVVVPPAQMVRNLAAGTIDGFCSGEPYSTLAVQNGHGWIHAWASALLPEWPEKVLMVTERFAFENQARHLALVAALAEACRWCDKAENRAELVSILSRQEWVAQSPDTLLPALEGVIACGNGRIEVVPDFLSFHRHNANVPTQARAQLIQKALSDARLIGQAEKDLPHRIFREDIYRQALSFSPHELASP
ncbi:MAG: CmpA/NrtA family ABC transporter substrate-binding protein [Opitutaceae bacterium]|nr:CmpA/NrtA family ABC transporter substrate-binding protein [Opitutaceae bacterium]